MDHFSAVTRNGRARRLTFTRPCFLVLVGGAHPQNLSAHFGFTLYKEAIKWEYLTSCKGQEDPMSALSFQDGGWA
jgi:hypothetical protein